MTTIRSGRMRRAGWPTTDRGSTTAFAAGLSLVLVTAATVAVIVVTLVLATHKARVTADLAALAAAVAVTDGGDGCAAATTSASANRALTTSCRVDGRPASFVVTVTVRVDTGLRAPMPEAVSARSYAGNAV